MEENDIIALIMKIIGAYAATTAISLVFYVPAKLAPICGIVGMGGWLANLLMLYYNVGRGTSSFAAAVTVTVLARIFSRKCKTPQTVFLIPGIITMVPGQDIYRTVFLMINGNAEKAGTHMTNALIVSGMIAMGIFIVDSIRWKNKSIKKSLPKNEEETKNGEH